MSTSNAAQFKTGLNVIHSNRTESLRDLTIAWLEKHPLPDALAEEVILTHSQGMAQWLKFGIATHTQVAAALSFQLPMAFLWQCYRTVLGAENIPRTSPFDKPSLRWHIYRHLIEWIDTHPELQPLRPFLDNNDDQRRFQLAEQLADVFDQYQVYRADWLDDWQHHRDVLRNLHSNTTTLPDTQTWQPVLWRCIMSLLGSHHAHRAALHTQFLKRLKHQSKRPEGLPHRIIVFGISTLPAQTIEALDALSQHCHVLMLVHNPCRHYWGDIVEGRENIRRALRHSSKSSHNTTIDLKDLHLYSHPLLAAWGRQGRDFIALLDKYDHPDHYRTRFAKIDLFDEQPPENEASLLQHLHWTITELEPLPPEPTTFHAPPDAIPSIQLHVAHSPLREIEILHDQLLALFEHDRLSPPLEPNEVIVMTPDITTYAPFIHAVFGQKYPNVPDIPYAITDQTSGQELPICRMLDVLLHLPEQRLTLSDLLDWLNVESFAQRFDLTTEEIERLRPWLQDVGIRWGLDAEHRNSFDLPPNSHHNTWKFGLERMLLGYALGNQRDSWKDIAPYAEISGLEASLIGKFSSVFNTLKHYQHELTQTATPAAWQEKILRLIDECLIASQPQEQRQLDLIASALETWLQHCQDADLAQTSLPLSVVREIVFSALNDAQSITVHFLGGRVTFGTLMPMRAIPFRVVCILGMNHDAYPRIMTSSGFDLMRDHYRAGDRSRREDDRYLLLEACLSAREYLYISYVGQNIHTNESLPPSILVSQLCDWLDANWCDEHGHPISKTLTVQHPLQPFHHRYFVTPDEPSCAPTSPPNPKHAPLWSYAKNWHTVHIAQYSQPENTPSAPLAEQRPDLHQTINITQLGKLLRYPERVFFRQRLNIYFPKDKDIVDHEPFDLDPYNRALIERELFDEFTAQNTDIHNDEHWSLAFHHLQQQGRLPHSAAANLIGNELRATIETLIELWQSLQTEWLNEYEHPLALEWHSQHGYKILATLPAIRSKEDDKDILLRQIIVGDICDKNSEVKGYKLIEFWPQHLLAAACGYHATTAFLNGRHFKPIILPSIDADTAQKYLNQIIDAWITAHQQPLPVAAKTASEWLNEKLKKNATEETIYFRTQIKFEESDRRFSRELQRAWPQFKHLFDAGFPQYTEQLYGAFHTQLINALSPNAHQDSTS